MLHFGLTVFFPNLLFSSVTFHLGFEKTELLCRSWYSLIHPEDLSHASAQHYRLCESPPPNVPFYLPHLEKLWLHFCATASVNHLSGLTFSPVLLPPVGDASETQAEMVVRLQTKDGINWIWIYSLLRIENAEVPITCHNYIIR